MKVTKNGFAGQSLGDQPALLLLRGKSGRSESPAADVAEAVNALMQAVHFPAAASINTQVSPVFYNDLHALQTRFSDTLPDNTRSLHCTTGGVELKEA